MKKIIIRDIFVAKPGNASKLAKLMKEAFSAMPGSSEPKVMTDLVGNYNTVVVETMFENLAEFEKEIEDYSKKKMPAEVQQKMANYTDMYMEGRREIFRIVE